MMAISEEKYETSQNQESDEVQHSEYHGGKHNSHHCIPILRVQIAFLIPESR